MSATVMPQPTWRWLSLGVLRAIHEEQLQEHGGASGLRDLGLLESAVSRPENLVLYGTPDAADLAAAYGYGIARNHPFVDGNKRTAFVAVELFLALNAFELLANDASCVLCMLNVAAGELSEAAFADWIRKNIGAV
jgi:death on curing protein